MPKGACQVTSQLEIEKYLKNLKNFPNFNKVKVGVANLQQ